MFHDWAVHQSPTDNDTKKGIYTWNVNGPIHSYSNEDSSRVMPSSGQIRSIYMELSDSGTSGNTIIDIKKRAAPAPPTPGVQFSPNSPSTIYTTPANRPKIAAASATRKAILSILPDITAFNKGDTFTLDILLKAKGGPRDLSIVMEVDFI